MCVAACVPAMHCISFVHYPFHDYLSSIMKLNSSGLRSCRR